ncbi:lipid-A-disaccharide synthase-related protein [Cyanobium sp. ATX 6A2]|uniref:lipid-A-disaccharide synthase-related protein n=1 Tax=Cyanobium sp. ATX 6A2 TaxID=2823700 RepID=UPI0020CDC04F|nr:lipid-A-disaccharide synthase-related protein [Cyanobium sp. ATX 6A2]MCP9889211.1 lipid-A-disaccharide synthase-related protein [Cyanobium sp. ATX 6A2]
MGQGRVLLLSNGHGEDLSGALIASALRRRGVPVVALPLVGHGEPYRRSGIEVLGRTRAFSTGGLGFTSLAGQVRELLEGQTLHVILQLARLRQRSRGADLVVAVGDVVAVLGSWLSGRPAAVYLVAYSSHYEGRLRLPWPCGWLLRRHRIAVIWARDRRSAEDLSGQLRRPVRFLGNPFLDAVITGADSSRGGAGSGARQQLLLLPGSRLPEAEHNLALLLQLLPRLTSRLPHPQQLRISAALVGSLSAQAVHQLAAPLGWMPTPRAGGSQGLRHRHGLELELAWSGFATRLAAADLVLAMAGTATEQAVGLGKPVLQLVGRGPQFTSSFAEAQRRLLGPAVLCAAGEPPSLDATAALGAELLQRLADPRQGPALQRQWASAAAERLGAAGGSERLAAAIMDLLGRHGGTAS